MGPHQHAGGKADQRVPAFDLTFSAPRSVSLVWATRNFEAAQERAVRTSLATIEREAILARRGQGGTRVEKVALTAALFSRVGTLNGDSLSGHRAANITRSFDVTSLLYP
jgi:hypothetical protein